MSFYNSLKQLWIKVEQKNIVLCSGNIDEIIYDGFREYRDVAFIPDSNQDEGGNFISIIDHLCSLAKGLGYTTVKCFSPNLGIVDYLNNDNKQQTQTTDEFGFDDQIASNGLDSFVETINNEINLIRGSKKDKYKDLYILECSDIMLDRNANNSSLMISKLIESFVQFSKQTTLKMHMNKFKLVILARSPDSLNAFISRNNSEFSSITLLKPDKKEREQFYKHFKTKFDCLINSAKEPTHSDFRDVITLSDDMSFRELFQYSKIDKKVIGEPSQLNFSQLYKLVNFNKKDSEWEKIDLEKIKSLDRILSDRVKGQQNAIEVVKKTLVRSFTGMNGVLHSSDNNKKPKGILFLVGPTGTGKTELAKAISQFIFGDENRIIRFDMSEFSQEQSDQRLIGAPPGYVGYDAGGELTNAVKQKPFSILLFDEIEKAHGRILDKFLQILEDGRLTSSQGEIIDFSETFIIFTSNIGTKEFSSNPKSYDEVKEHFINKVKEHFTYNLSRPEILNRIGEKNIVPFNFVTDETIIANIIEAKLKKFIKYIETEKLIKLTIDDFTKQKITKNVIKTYDKMMGGRGIVSELETHFIDEFSNFIFNNYELLKNNKDKSEFTFIKAIYNDVKIDFDVID